MRSPKSQMFAFAIVAMGLVILAANNRTSGWSTSNLPPETQAIPNAFNVAPEFAHGTWINSDPLTLEKLRGRVVLIEFWAFSCSNCRNTLPSVKRWHDHYQNRGLTIIGVHSPKFQEEKKIENVRREVASLGLKYPIVTDNDYETWRAYRIEAWPTLLVIDKAGRIRWKLVGEGRYEETETIIKKLLAEKAPPATDKIASKGEIMPDKFEKTDEEWRKILTPDQYNIMRQAGTERAFSGEYWDNHEHGVYFCGACGLPLFSSDTKYDSGTGWPSFYAPIADANIIASADNSLGMVRTEVRCRRCGSHLGHVFDDGPKPSGLRYCMNSGALKFEEK